MRLLFGETAAAMEEKSVMAVTSVLTLWSYVAIFAFSIEATVAAPTGKKEHYLSRNKRSVFFS